MTIRYYRVRRGRGFWRPNDAMKTAGFADTPCGPDGPAAWAKAEEMNAAWDAYRTGQTPTAYRAKPAGSISEAWERFRQTEEWHRKAPRTREEWDRVWKRAEPVFGDLLPRSVTLEHISLWRTWIEKHVSLREAHRCIKVWRAAWKTWAAMGYCSRDADPSLGVRNTAPAPRTARWNDPEAVRLIKQAWRLELCGFAAALAVMWESSQSPVDIRSLDGRHIIWESTQAGAVAVIRWKRAKTGAEPVTRLTRRASRVLLAFLRKRKLKPGAAFIGPVFLTRTLTVGYTKNRFSEDFDTVRVAAFGPDESRQMQDFRRSGIIEAITGDASPATVARGAGNTLATSNTLFRTYAPPDITASIKLAEARKKGRAMNKTGQKVATDRSGE